MQREELKAEVATSAEPADPGKPDILEDLGVNMSTKVSVSSENERFADAERKPSPAELTLPCPSQEAAPEESLSINSEFLRTPKDVTEEVSKSSGWGMWGCSLLTNISGAIVEILSFLEGGEKKTEDTQDRAASDAEDGALGAEYDGSDAGNSAPDARDSASDAGNGPSDVEDSASDSEGGALDFEDDDRGAQDAVLGWGGVALPWPVQEDEFEWANIRSGRKGKIKEKSWITNPGPADRASRGRKKNKRKRGMFL